MNQVSEIVVNKRRNRRNVSMCQEIFTTEIDMASPRTESRGKIIENTEPIHSPKKRLI